jgi:tetratricopeptide (TPR) repeat protein
LEAAAAFTEALDYIEANADTSNPSSSLNKQIVTLINNRSAMYEKGNLPELAIEDCNKILEVYDISHNKARQRKLRILETKYNDYYQALVECCALQLLYMQQNRDQLRMGLPASSPPPIPQNKLEELVQKLIPEQLEEYYSKARESQKNDPRLPSDYTLSQLMKSYMGYNAWMAKAAKDGPVSKLKKELQGMPEQPTEDTAIADKASVTMRLGRRYVYDGQYVLARDTLLKAYDMVSGKPKVQAVMKDDDYARLLEWTGMVKHWTYDLSGADACYQMCAELEPINVSVDRNRYCNDGRMTKLLNDSAMMVV